MQRKLTVILSADVVGYSVLMERDEAGTLSRLKENRKSLFDPRVAAQSGRTFKVMGDGVLVEFPSAGAAVSCAIEIQAAMEAAEAHRPDSERLRYRIGINLGDVIVEGDDIYGEGVNVAARLQALAPVGGIAVARNVKDQVAGKIAAEFEDRGSHAVKEGESPVHVFAVRPQASVAATAEKRPAVSICVLPFANMSGDQEQEYFSDGITEDIITDLSKVSALWVAARNTSFTFKGKPVDVPQAARSLKVTHVLEGSVRKAGGRVRITAQLIDASGGHVWAERWDRDLNDIFALQDEISEAVVKALRLKLLPEEKKRIERRDTSNPEAYELFLLARQFERTGSERMKPLIVRICQKVVALDPAFARGWAVMAMAIAEMSQRGVAGYSIEDARQAAQRAIEVDPLLAEGHAAMAEVMGRGPGMELEAGKPFIETALTLDPNCYDAHLFAGYLTLGLKQHAEAIRHFETACDLDPDAYRPAGMVVQVYEAIGDDERVQWAARRCLERCEKLLRFEPDHSGALGFLVSSLADLGEVERAREWAKRVALFDPDNMRLRYNTACGMSKLGDVDAAMDLLEPLVGKISPGWAHWIDIDNSLDPIRDHPRFKAFRAKLAEAT
ncbi:MAG: adenylate/guanylate cyclase domain-containing protein [Phycisphaerales bacterium]|nr:adenylate/guanylate cyclase domain-containing protein [Hyphomonadaceae bacterium]